MGIDLTEKPGETVQKFHLRFAPISAVETSFAIELSVCFRIIVPA